MMRLAANLCPDPRLWARNAWLLNTSSEVVFTARRAATDPEADIETAMGRLGDLLGLIETNSHLMNCW